MVVFLSQNCAAVLPAASIADLFDLRVDGEVVVRLYLAGKPAPDTVVTDLGELLRCIDASQGREKDMAR